MVASKTAGSGAVARAAAPAAANQGGGARGLPAGVTVESDKTGNYYSFSVGGKSIQFEVTNEGRRSAEIIFDVGGNLNRGSLQGRDAVRAAQTVRRVFEHDASTRPDGFKYQVSAYTRDGFGAERAAAYKKIGFSKPIGGPGGHQYGYVKGGKLVKQ